MSLLLEDIKSINDHWALVAIGRSQRLRAEEVAKVLLLRQSVGNQLDILESPTAEDIALVQKVALGYEVAAVEGLDALVSPVPHDSTAGSRKLAQAGAYCAFELRRVLPVPVEDDARIFHVLHLSALAYASDRWSDLRRWLKDRAQNITPPAASDVQWDKRVLFRLYESWVRLFRKDGWNDLDGVREIVSGLRDDQQIFESVLLKDLQGASAGGTALRLLALYHLARATEILAVYMLQGEPNAVDAELDKHFEAAKEATMHAGDMTFEVILRWLHVAARKMASNSVWWIARSGPSKLTDFVSRLTKSRSMFELLPPQQLAIREQGLLDPAARAVVVDFPTSGGKTVLAQFRILQALNQFDNERGWVAYVAPTRALVSQITRRLRADFLPLGFQVEQLSSVVDIDAFEEELLKDADRKTAFHVLVTTPEKLDLVIRNQKVTRPLALVVVDEAHNIENEERGLRIELLLAMIKRDCPKANFLLLMPFVPNASDLAKWLAPEGGKTVSLGTGVWQPNERVVGAFGIERVEGRGRGAWKINFETLTTGPRSMHLEGRFSVGDIKPLPIPYSKAKSLTIQAGAIATVFSDRGTSVAIGRTIPDVWNMARQVTASMSPCDVSEEVALVRRFLATEVSPEFELISMLERGVAVHHAGLSDETRALVEWLAETGKVKVLCATTTLAQGINFPVSSVFLASRHLPTRDAREMSKRDFWNLAGRAGRIGQDSVGVVGIAAGSNPENIRKFVLDSTEELISRLVTLLDEIDAAGKLNELSLRIEGEQWSDFRRYVAHLWMEKQNLNAFVSDTEQLLRNTYGYGSLQGGAGKGKEKAKALLDATKAYVAKLASNPGLATLAESTGFAPEGVGAALAGLSELKKDLSLDAWKPEVLFGSVERSILPELVGVMMRVPEVKSMLQDSSLAGTEFTHIAEVAQEWVSGTSIEAIAKKYFSSEGSSHNLTDAISGACKGIYRSILNGGTWGLAALSKMPNSGIPFDQLPPEQARLMNTLPAMLYHGVKSEAAVMMRMNSVPRSVAEPMGNAFTAAGGLVAGLKPQVAREFLRSRTAKDWQSVVPKKAAMSGADYQTIWKQLAGE